MRRSDLSFCFMGSNSFRNIEELNACEMVFVTLEEKHVGCTDERCIAVN